MNPELSSTERLIDRVARNPALDPIADAIQPELRRLLDGTGSSAWLKNALHGTWLGHSLHAIITDIPIGAWTVAAILDALEVAGRRDLAPGADAAVLIGIAGGVGAIVTGLAEWSDTKDEPKRLGLAHALLNDAGFSAYVLAFILRRTGKRGAGIATAFFGYGMISLAAYLGGELSFGMQIGVKHTAEPVEPPEAFTAVLPEHDLEIDRPTRVDLAGAPVLLVRDEHGIHAISAVCTHRGAPLDQGALADGCIVCPWHGSRFAIRDGSVREGPATFPQARFETRVLAGQIELRPLR